MIAARWFAAKDYALALAEKERTGAIMRRYVHPAMGVGYEVRYVPQDNPPHPRIAVILDELTRADLMGEEERLTRYGTHGINLLIAELNRLNGA